MKKLIAMGAMMGVACGAFAQGTVLFDNNNSGEIDVLTAGNTANAIGAGTNPGGLTWHMGLLFNATPGGGIAQSSLTEIADYIPNVANTAGDGQGYFQDTAGGQEVVITTPSGSGTATFEVVSWLGSATTWAAALQNPSANPYTGVSPEFTAKIANPSTV